MKKLFLMFAAVAALFATSCVTDTTSDVAVTGGECDVTLSVVAPGADSRTIGDGLKALKLTCGVYDANWNYLTSVPGEFTGSTTTTLSMRLVKGKTYHFVFWAQNPNAPYTLALGTVGEVSEPIITVDYSNVNANDDTLDAFFGKLTDYPVNGTVNETVYLKRPFAQINFGTSDHLEAKEFGFDVVDDATATTKVTVTTYTGLSLKSGDIVGNPTEVTFKAAALPEDKTLVTNNGNYYWLAMNYILVPEIEVSLAQCDLTVTAQGQEIEVKVPMAPAKRNWRTNLVGQLLTEQGNLTIEILPIPEGELPNPDDNNLVHELLLTAAVGGEITLTDDVVTPHTLVVLSDMTLDLGGKSLAIDNTTRSAQTSDPVIQVKKGAKLILKNGTVKSEVVNGGATIKNEGELILLDGVNVVGAPISTEGGYPSYCIQNAANLTINEGVTISADRGCLFLSGEGETVINGGTLRNNDISDKRESFTSHVIVVGYGANNKLTINGGTFNHLHTKTSGGVVVNNWSAVTVDINGGDFRGGNYFGKWDNLSDYGYGSTKTPFCVKGGSFSGFDNKFLAAGYKAVEADGLYYVVAEEVDAVVTTATEAMSAIKVENQTIILAPAENGGQHLMGGKMSLASGVSLIGLGNEPVAVFNDWGSNAFANQAHFTNTTVENISFTNNLVIDAGIANGDVHFKNCVFGGDRAHQGVHFDSGNATIVFDGCTFVGRNMFGASLTKVVFNNCTFLNKKSSLTGADKWTGVNMWGKYEFNNCVFDTEATCNVKCDGVEAVFTSCKYVDNRDITTVVKNSENNDCTILFK